MKRFLKKFCATLLIVTLMTTLVQDVAKAEENTQSSNNTLAIGSDTSSLQPVSSTTDLQSSDNSSDNNQTDIPKSQPTALYELTDKREVNVKQFMMSDNTIQAVVYTEPVHYKENGTL